MNNIKITAQPGITKEEIERIVEEEKALYAGRHKVLAEINLSIKGEEIAVESFAQSPIKRVRRITGYLSEVHKFNDAKQDELHDRVRHVI